MNSRQKSLAPRSINQLEKKKLILNHDDDDDDND